MLLSVRPLGGAQDDVCAAAVQQNAFSLEGSSNQKSIPTIQMAYPRQAEIEVPLLQAIAEFGGAARPRDVYPKVAEAFPQLTPEDLEARLPNYPSTRKWSNLVQWVRQVLVEHNEIDGSERGIWKITDAGQSRLVTLARSSRATKGGQAQAVQPIARVEPNLRDLVNTNHEEIKARLLAELKSLTPRAFEHFCKELLAQLGFRSLVVTKRSQDGGLDGFGDFRQGVISIRSAFEAKKWADSAVGRREIDRFRGAIQGEFDHGVFLTTSRFTKDAVDASLKRGAITILLLDGPAIAELLVERGIGVRRIPLYLFDVDDEFFDIADD